MTSLRNVSVSDSCREADWSSSDTITIAKLRITAAAHRADAALGGWACSPHSYEGLRDPPKHSSVSSLKHA